jgi:hypothetical protein
MNEIVEEYFDAGSDVDWTPPLQHRPNSTHPGHPPEFKFLFRLPTHSDTITCIPLNRGLA